MPIVLLLQSQRRNYRRLWMFVWHVLLIWLAVTTTTTRGADAFSSSSSSSSQQQQQQPLSLIINSDGDIMGAPDDVASTEDNAANSNNKYKERSSSSSSSWSNMLSVDPTQILSILIDRGGLLLPDQALADLKLLRKFFRVDHAELNVVERHVILHNVALAMPPDDDGPDKAPPPALRIGRVYLHWDSYTQPCLDIQVQDVDILVEFTNLQLTDTNWNELNRAGLFASLQSWDTTDDDYYDVLSFVRIASIDLLGSISVRLNSRPLDHKPIGTFSLDMESTTREISAEIREVSRRNAQDAEGRQQRPGCSAAEVVSILQTYFSKKIQTFLVTTLIDLTNDSNKRSATSSVVREAADEILLQASDTILNYAREAGRKTSENLQDSVTTKLIDLGLAEPGDDLYTITKRAAKVVQQERGRVLAVRDKLKDIWSAIKENINDDDDDESNPADSSSPR